MDINEIEMLLKKFRWHTLQRMYGCAHSSIIGFISTEWISLSLENSILDGAPSPIIGNGRAGQTNADILLCKDGRPVIPVEVETDVSKYKEKTDSLFAYLSNKKDFDGIEFGLLFMTNLCNGDTKYKHNWEKIKLRATKSEKNNIALVSIIKERARLGKDSPLNVLRKRNDYFPWDIITVDYWIYSANRTKEGNLWRK
ncbi:MAG: hypothetical protein H8E22_02695 [Candidatus Cloacimonetes bacterium]|nr:hypothetical protein [Candidatus Cloacimonadota bacterium]